ncbi:TatD family hydrolase [Candidatus Uabimicrobium amorphum]|uniref:TatD family hydrolase n=1 Tax=Uabimicrobium amorphum TaxID=2596890 RepID=A0A5S9IKC5_UABAM|nr:TatD family hydrolase [Candidatus Uabimicrobium amorphum]BBM83140.1 TatD family hydrolase [Candidatus Uabimicrobium amorphum]
MKFFDPHIHMTARTTDDYQRMVEMGIRAVCEPAFWLGQPRTHAGTYEDYLKTIIGWERFRASQFGIHHFCTIALNPREANSHIAPEVMELLPLYIHKESVLGIGEIGLDDMTSVEEKYFLAQLQLAKEHNLPVIIHTPHRNKKEGTQRSIDIVKEVGINQKQVVIDHNMEETLPLVLEQTDCWAGHTIYPQTKMSKDRMVKLVQQYGVERILVNSSADWGMSDPLNIPKTAGLMKEANFSDADIEKLFWKNPIAFYASSGKISEEMIAEPIKIDQTQFWEDNSILRGQSPVVE